MAAAKSTKRLGCNKISVSTSTFAELTNQYCLYKKIFYSRKKQHIIDNIDHYTILPSLHNINILYSSAIKIIAKNLEDEKVVIF
jgi:hypothetical protein